MNIIDKELELESRKKLIRHIKSWHTDSYIPLISEWASENRYLPAGTTEWPGLVDHTIAPYLVEIQDACHPLSGIQSITIRKGTQTGVTTSIENFIGHSIKYKLHNIIYIITTQSMAKMRSSAAIDTMIDNSNLGDCVKPMSNRTKRKTSDTSTYKEFHGNRRLLMTSYGSIADAKSFTYSAVIFDELEEAGKGDFKGQGDIEKIFQGRSKTIRDYKFIKISTPTNTQGRITRNYLEGDQREYYCRCLLCGEFQVLEMMMAGRDFGLFATCDVIDNIPIVIPDSVKYVCKHCKKDLYEYQKGDMLNSGKWIPTARPVNPNYRSYQVSNLMSPVMFYSWRQCMQDFAETDFGQNILKFKNFQIDVLGLPWETRAEKKDWKELKDRAENYPLEVVPDGGLIVSGGVDVQKRWLEIQCVAWGRGLESWPIYTEKFHGDTYDPNGKCWQDLENFIRTKRFKLKGITVPITLTAIDSGYNPGAEESENSIRAQHVVYEFVARNYKNTIAARGNPKLKDTIIKEERIKQNIPLKIRYDVAVNDLKDEIFIKIDFAPGTQGYMHFPKDFSDDYFKGFLSEVFTEIEPGKWGYKKVFDRNEPLDTWILCRAAAERLNLASWTEPVWNQYEIKILQPQGVRT